MGTNYEITIKRGNLRYVIGYLIDVGIKYKPVVLVDNKPVTLAKRRVSYQTALKRITQHSISNMNVTTEELESIKVKVISNDSLKWAGIVLV